MILIHKFDPILVLGHCSVIRKARSFGVEREYRANFIQLLDSSKKAPSRVRHGLGNRAGTVKIDRRIGLFTPEVVPAPSPSKLRRICR